MHKMIWPGAAAAILAMSALAGAQQMSGSMAQDSMAKPAMGKDAMAKSESYSGCLAKGDAPNTFVLKDAQEDAMMPMKDGMMKDGMAKDAMKKDDMSKGDGMMHDAAKSLALSSKDVKFGKYVGKKVTVTGGWAKNSTADDAMAHDSMAKDAMAPFIVTAVKAAAGKCS